MQYATMFLTVVTHNLLHSGSYFTSTELLREHRRMMEHSNKCYIFSVTRVCVINIQTATDVEAIWLKFKAQSYDAED